MKRKHKKRKKSRRVSGTSSSASLYTQAAVSLDLGQARARQFDTDTNFELNSHANSDDDPTIGYILLGIAFVYFTQGVGFWFIVSFYMSWFLGKRQGRFSEAFKNIFISATFGIGLLCAFILFLRFFGGTTSPGSLRAWEESLISFHLLFKSYVNWTFFSWTIVVALLSILSYLMPQLKLVSRFLLVRSVLSRIFLASTVLVQFSFFSSVPAFLALESVEKQYITSYEINWRSEQDAVGNYLAARTLENGVPYIDSSQLDSFIMQIDSLVREADDSASLYIDEFVDRVADAEIDELFLLVDDRRRVKIEKSFVRRLKSWNMTLDFNTSYVARVTRALLNSSYANKLVATLESNSLTGKIDGGTEREEIRAPAKSPQDLRRKEQILKERVKSKELAQRHAEDARVTLREVFAKALGQATPEAGEIIEVFLNTLIKTLARKVFDVVIANRFTNLLSSKNLPLTDRVTNTLARSSPIIKHMLAPPDLAEKILEKHKHHRNWVYWQIKDVVKIDWARELVGRVTSKLPSRIVRDYEIRKEFYRPKPKVVRPPRKPHR